MPKPTSTVVIIWVLCLLVSLFFLNMAYHKLIDGDAMARLFELWGYSTRFMLFVGAVELAGALLILWPRSTTWGALLLSVEMAGAVYTDLSTGLGAVAVPATCLVVLVSLAWMRRDRALGLA
jgi:putative oxidoreductase